MEVIKVSEVKSVELGDDQPSVGKMIYRQLLDDRVAKSFWSFYATFPLGRTSGLHQHGTEQLLFFTEGKGLVGTDTEEHEVTAGTLVLIPAGQRHYHGATSTTSCSHLAVILEGPDAGFRKMIDGES